MPVGRTVGTATVVALEDGGGTFFRPRGVAFPAATPDDWARADAFDPGAVTQTGEWLLRFRCFALLLEDGTTIIVDAGIGPAGAPAASWAPVPGRLPVALTEAGIDPADVTAVVLTHLHTDHIGWAADETLFPNARHVLQRAEYDAVDSLNPVLRERLLDPLRAADRLQLVDGTTTLASGLSTMATPGHTPGHQCVLLSAGNETVAFTGDLMAHAIQVLDPAQPYLFESDPDRARESRVALLARVGRGTLATAHLTEPFIRSSL